MLIGSVDPAGTAGNADADNCAAGVGYASEKDKES